jgi:hypothetical protein
MNKMSLKKIEEEISKVEKDDIQLYDFLYNLAYSNLGNISYLPIYEKYLTDKREDIKGLAIKIVLFMLRIREDKYRKIAIESLLDDDADEDLRLIAASALAQAYFGTRDTELLVIYYKIFNDADNEYLKATCFDAMMRVIGISSKEQFERNGRLIEKASQLDQLLYKKEFEIIRSLLNIK